MQIIAGPDDGKDCPVFYFLTASGGGSDLER